jgi:hypothetical protein
MASTSSTDGRGFPIEIEEPRSFTGFPLKLTWPPGSADERSKGILDGVVAHPENRTMAENTKRIKLF